ncbi:AbrB/MazE/SpoVT family DNA-binding domain-containing protein [Rhizobium sp. 18055]|uniref:AbrB/MazE/SpoVT family DNA-binding domain-containing protein n=1 Tax=Rhizobium sp. 18055 TaxID=2681403 RepID=UPI001356FE52|nr:AbrB/MazE/SpoVT family DNA-binding domain-containing protein [Rhizobium sp. 18055]
MNTTKMSKTGAIVLPKAVRDAHGFEPGVEFEVIDGGGVITLRPVETPAHAGTLADADTPVKKLTAQEFLDSIPKYKGPPIELTSEAIREAIDQEAIEDWERLERQWNEDKND